MVHLVSVKLKEFFVPQLPKIQFTSKQKGIKKEVLNMMKHNPNITADT